jgi:hypothetical protein
MADLILPKAHFQRILTEITNTYTQHLGWNLEFVTQLQQRVEGFLRDKAWLAFNLRLKVEDRLEEEGMPIPLQESISVLEALDLLTIPKTIKVEDFPPKTDYEEPAKRETKVYRKFTPMSDTLPTFKGGPITMKEIEAISESMLQRLTLAGIQGLRLSPENYETIRQLLRIYLIDFLRFATVSLRARYEFYMELDPRVYLIPKEVRNGTLTVEDFNYAVMILDDMYSQDRSETVLETLYQEAIRDLEAEKREQEDLDANWAQLESEIQATTILQYRTVIQRLTRKLERLTGKEEEVPLDEDSLPATITSLADRIEELLERDHQERLHRTAAARGMITVEDLNAYLGLESTEE